MQLEPLSFSKDMQSKLRPISAQFDELCKIEEQRTHLENELQNTQKLYHRASYKGYPVYQLHSYQISYDAMRNDFDETTLRYRNKLVILLKQTIHMLFTSMADRANSEQRCVDLGYRLLESFDAEPRHVVQSSIYQSLQPYSPMIEPTDITEYSGQKKHQHNGAHYRLGREDSDESTSSELPAVNKEIFDKCCEHCHAIGNRQEKQQNTSRQKIKMKEADKEENTENSELVETQNISHKTNMLTSGSRRLNLTPGAARFARLSSRLSAEFGLESPAISKNSPHLVDESKENKNSSQADTRFRGSEILANSSKNRSADDITYHHGNLSFSNKRYDPSSSLVRSYSNASVNPFAVA